MGDESTKLSGRKGGGQTGLAALSLLLFLGGLFVLYLDNDPGGMWFGGKWEWAYLIVDTTPPFFDIVGSRAHAGRLHIRLTWLGGTLFAMGLGIASVTIVRRT